MPDYSPPSHPRAAAIGDLLTALDRLLADYQFLPAADREARWAAEADRITGEVSRQLAVARSRLSSGYTRSSPTAR